MEFRTVYSVDHKAYSIEHQNKTIKYGGRPVCFWPSRKTIDGMTIIVEPCDNQRCRVTVVN
jgi:hypothetical protein